MPNMRLVPANAADAAILTASSAAFPPENLQTAQRTQVWRATGTTATLTATWATPVPLDSVALMTSNLSATATWRIRPFDALGAALFDSGAVAACLPPPPNDLGWETEQPGVNTFAFGVASQSVLWLPSKVSAKSLQIDLIDPANPAGYIEASRLVVGTRWEPAYNMGAAVQITFEEHGKQSRAEDGTLRSEPGAKSRALRFSLDCLKEPDRAQFSEIARRLGTKTDFLISAYPEAAAPALEEHHTMIGKFISALGVGKRNYDLYATQVEVGEV